MCVCVCVCARAPGRKMHARIPDTDHPRLWYTPKYTDTHTHIGTCRRIDSETERKSREEEGNMCVHRMEPNVAAMVAMCILISSAFRHSACTGVH